MRGNVASRTGIVAGLLSALAILVSAYAEKHHLGAHAAPAQHTISAPVTHMALRASPVTIDIDLAQARVSVEVSL